MTSAPEDLRDLGGRLSRLIVSIVVGVAGAFAIAYCLPLGPSHRWSCLGRAGSQVVHEDAPLIIAGAVILSLAVYAVLGWLARERRSCVPRAYLVR